MPEHHQRNVTGTLYFCSVCNKKTLHNVSDRRLGSCTEHAASGLSKAQEKTQREREEKENQPELF